MATTTITFFAPEGTDWTPDILARRDSRVRVMDYDEVTRTSRIQFRDGFTLVVPTFDLLHRETEV